jgi:cyclopropane fatty-acyl-phospholipid synthase-like methyltransferase
MAEPQEARACANAAQAAEWDGPAGAHRTKYAAVFDAETRPHNERLRAAAGVAPRDRVLDVGCGTGQTTRDAARAATAGSALGVDLSAQMLEHARMLSRE